jgi:chromatin structure-remodeling complex subunit RSC9
METPTLHRLTDVPIKTLERVASFLLLDIDDDLVTSSLDFLYQYTALPENLDFVLKTSPTLLPSLTSRLANLLLHSARPFEERIMVRAAQKHAPNTTIANIPGDLHAQLLGFPEPERSSCWLKCCFEESPADDITQIAIWQAYQGRFLGNSPIPAADFIKNVSNTFNTAQAQVINGPQPRFIIKGIRPRRVLLNLKGMPLLKCMWEGKTEISDLLSRPLSRPVCGEWHSSRQTLWSHILTDHVHIPGSEDGQSFSNQESGSYVCRWSGCMRSPEPLTTPRDIGLHVRLHIPDIPTEQDNSKSDIFKEPEFTRHTFYSTPVDEKNIPAGIGWTSILVMRNLARYANRQQFQNRNQKTSLMDDFFGHVKTELWHNVSVSRTLMFWLNDLMKMVTKIDMAGLDGIQSSAGEGNRDASLG